jgi:UDP-N-acetylglucosamine:LPS N-acetylglucosamine transferase
MTTLELDTAINESGLVLARSGYTTIMDLAKLRKKGFFIPTPGQFEQLYLAEKLQSEQIAPFCFQDDFNIEKLTMATQFSGFSSLENHTDFKALFSLFQGE